VCVAAVGLVGDIARALGSNILTHCDHFMQILLENLAVSSTGDPSSVRDCCFNSMLDCQPLSGRLETVAKNETLMLRNECFRDFVWGIFFSPKFCKLPLKAGFHMIADDRGSQIAKSSAIICDRLRSCDRDRRRSQTIAVDRTMFYLLRSSAIVCDRLRSIAIVRSYENQSSAICDRKVSHNILNSDP